MRWRPHILCTFLLVAAVFALAACPPGPVPPNTSLPNAPPAPVRWNLLTARRQTSYLKLDQTVVISGTKITLSPPKNTPALKNWNGAISLSAARLLPGRAEGPMVEQLTGLPRAAADAGSYLVPLAPKTAGATHTFDVPEPLPLYFKVSVPATTPAGVYRFPVYLAAPGQPVEETTLAVEVADLTLPTDPRVLAVATTTVESLARLYPAAFGNIPAQYLDRADIDHRAAVEQLDALVRAARAQGVALFVEDLIPTLRVDETGRVALDWDAYDRVLQPYMDGTAFDDRVPLGVWLAPVPPGRIRDATTQLWQYIDLCAKHFAAKGWVGVPAFLHPAMCGGNGGGNGGGGGELDKLQSQASAMLRLHMPREMLAVAGPGADVPHGQLWAVNDADARLPPAGALGNEYSVRAWPWMCVARGNLSGPAGVGGSPTGVKGLVWRNALSAADAPVGSVSGAAAPVGNSTRPLFVLQNKSILPTLRLTWLNAGLNDAALLGLVEQRGDTTHAGMLAEILAGMVGRTGLENSYLQPPPSTLQPPTPDALPLAPTGYLYAGWPADPAVWDRVTPHLVQLILASNPGTRAALKPDDPAYLAARLWLAGTRRPVARLAGYAWSLRTGALGGTILDSRLHLLLENPVAADAEIELRFAGLPGDFQMAPPSPTSLAPVPPPRPLPGTARPAPATVAAPRRTATLAPASLADVLVPLAGHLAALLEAPGVAELELTERFNGATLRLPVRLPVYRMHHLEPGQLLRMDGMGDDWLLDTQTRVFGTMQLATRYLSRVDLLAAAARPDDQPASVSWTYDADYLYMLARCPQASISDDRTTEWPVAAAGGAAGAGTRWWGSDGLQLELGALDNGLWKSTGKPGEENPYARVLKIAFKPAGVLLVRTGQVVRDPRGMPAITWRDGPPPTPPGVAVPMGVTGIKYGITTQQKDGRVSGYTVEAAIPRVWVEVFPPAGAGPWMSPPAWRVNLLRHRAAELVSSSWSGPVVDDDDVAMMGAMIGE